MKCKNCGYDLDMETKFCPNCGTPNEAFMKHIQDMEEYKDKFNDTSRKVDKNTRSFNTYIPAAVALGITLIVFVISFIMNNNYVAYDLNTKHQQKYFNQRSDDIKQETMNYIDKKDYTGAVNLYNKVYGVDYKSDIFTGWTQFYSCAKNYVDMKKAAIQYYDDNVEAYDDNVIKNIATKLSDINEICNKNWKERTDCEEALKQKEIMINDMNNFLKTYCKLNENDLISIKNMNETEITSLLSKRMFSE